MIDSATVPRAGQIVGVRQRLYLVDQVVDPVNPHDSTLVQLSCVDDDAQGSHLKSFGSGNSMPASCPKRHGSRSPTGDSIHLSALPHT